MLPDKSVLSTLKIWLSISIVLHIITSILSIGYHQGDEHFQILEFAGLKIGFNAPENLAWEFHYQMRPAIQPFFAVLAIKAFDFFSLTDPFIQTILFRMISSILSLVSMVAFILAFIDDFDNAVLKKWFITTSLLLWCLLYIDVRFSSEGWSASFLVLGVAMLRWYLDKNVEQNKIYYLILTGFIIGLSFVCRYQTGTFIIGLALWLFFIKKETFKTFSSLFIGAIAAVVIGIWIDYWFYGKITLTAFNYFTQNILENKVSNYGVSPWWYYFSDVIENGYVFFGVLCVFSFLILLLRNPKNIFVWSILPFIHIHSLIGHKESRFLFPILKFAPYIVLFSFVLLSRYKKIIDLILSRQSFVFFMSINAVLIVASCFTPAEYYIGVIRHIEYTYEEPIHFYYTDNNNPYENYGLFNHFYNKKRVIWEKIDTLSKMKIEKNRTTLLITTNKKKLDNVTDLRFCKIYQPFPEFLTENLTGWASRHTFPIIYSCEKKPTIVQ
ncbi:MAG TPA: hypothetical protein VK766_02355 [Cytophagaceae bacterium]|nr:hypothetical protein [Cytophagaceae bacterium]